MRPSIGVMMAEHIAVGLVENHQLTGPVRVFPEAETGLLIELPADQITLRLVEQIEAARAGREISAVGVGVPGIVRSGVIEDSPNLPQTKGHNLARTLGEMLSQRGLTVPVHIFNDADAMAAGIAATRGQLDRVVRVWWLGYGIGFGRYPQGDGVWEGGHMVVTLDPKERFCACGGIGHLEGIMGHRAMRLRFLDLEPEEVFEQAQRGDKRCADFVELWHRALAAATASSIHLDGPGKFYVSGLNARFVQTGTLGHYLYQMVKMSPLQGSQVEVIATSDETAIIGAAVNAERAISEAPQPSAFQVHADNALPGN
ncbi:MAG: ROK family protein [Blastocatellia bacterium]